MTDGSAPEPFQPALDPAAVEDMRSRLRAARWPVPVPSGEGDGWEWGVDLEYLRSLCAWWADEYDPAGMVERLTAWPSMRGRGVHFLHARSEGSELPILLIHGWPGAPLEFNGMIDALVAAGHDAVVPSLPGFGFSDAPEPPMSGTAIAAVFAGLMSDLGYERYAVHGGDWGAYISGRIAFAHPDAVAAFHTNGPGLLPIPADLEEPPLSQEEIDFAQTARKSQVTNGLHQLVQGQAPDSLGVGLSDSPAGLAAWLLPRYRSWSDCDGDLESRFSKRELCDLLTFYWAAGGPAASLRLYAATRLDRWRLQPGERIEVPAAIADFPAEIIRPPRQWTERICSDIRRWTAMPRGGHFPAMEEPELLAEDLTEFLAEL